MGTNFRMCSPMCAVPPIPMIRLCLQAGDVCIDGKENYIKQSFRNRYHILTAGGVKALSIPVKHTGGTPIATCDARIEYRKPWLRDHLRTLKAAYASAPFYIHYAEAIEDILACGAATLGEFFSQNFEKWCALLKVTLPYRLTETYAQENFELDLRQKIKHPSAFPEVGAVAPYPQVFDDRHPFAPNLSVIDLLMNEGPAAGALLKA